MELSSLTLYKELLKKNPTQQKEAKDIMFLLKSFSDKLEAFDVLQPDNDPPDFILKLDNNVNIALELTKLNRENFYQKR